MNNYLYMQDYLAEIAHYGKSAGTTSHEGSTSYLSHFPQAPMDLKFSKAQKRYNSSAKSNMSLLEEPSLSDQINLLTDKKYSPMKKYIEKGAYSLAEYYLVTRKYIPIKKYLLRDQIDG